MKFLPSMMAAIALLVLAQPVTAGITMACDFSSAEQRGDPMHYHWGISNRISPMRGFKMPVSNPPYINIVRPLGGKAKDGRKLIEEDTYRWDGTRYVYDWEPLKQQIDRVRNRAEVYQLMIDNPHWAFQRGLDLGGEDGIETYGNAWPPNDPEAWSRYIRAMLTELVRHYGREEVARWRYCIGREVGTKGHWRGTMQEFFKHYRHTERAIHAVLPEAKVGTHFLWASSRHSYGPDFVRWCQRHQVRYDFIGVSYYPFYDKLKRVDLEHVYQVDFAPIKDIPEWNPNATLEIHEFSLITHMSKKGNSFENAPQGHQEAFTVMLGKMMYQHGMRDIYRWGSGAGKLAEKAFLEMKGHRFYHHSTTGGPEHSGTMVDALFAHDETRDTRHIMIASYHADPAASGEEEVEILSTLPLRSGTEIRLRKATYHDGKLEWADWETVRTEGSPVAATSSLKLNLSVAPFTFQRIEFGLNAHSGRVPPPIAYTMTDPKTGNTVEASLVIVRAGKLVCEIDGRRLEIPISSLAEKDVEFLREWMGQKK